MTKDHECCNDRGKSEAISEMGYKSQLYMDILLFKANGNQQGGTNSQG